MNNKPGENIGKNRHSQIGKCQDPFQTHAHVQPQMNVVQKKHLKKNYAKQTYFTAGSNPSRWRFISSTVWDPCLLGVLLPYGPGTLTSGATEVDAPPFTGDWTLEGAPDLSHSVIGLYWLYWTGSGGQLLIYTKSDCSVPTPWNGARSCWIWGNLHHHLIPKQLRTEILRWNMGLLALQCTPCPVWTFRNRNWQHLSIRNQHTTRVQGQCRGL